jgi:large subunit ribosomal protein L24
MMQKFKVGDQVKITAGKDKDRTGKIEKIFPKKNKVLIPGVNIYKKHVKGAEGRKAGIYEIPRPLDFAKIALICPKCKKPTRVGLKLVEQNKLRVCKKCKKEIDKS